MLLKRLACSILITFDQFETVGVCSLLSHDLSFAIYKAYIQTVNRCKLLWCEGVDRMDAIFHQTGHYLRQNTAPTWSINFASPRIPSRGPPPRAFDTLISSYAGVWQEKNDFVSVFFIHKCLPIAWKNIETPMWNTLKIKPQKLRVDTLEAPIAVIKAGMAEMLTPRALCGTPVDWRHYEERVFEVSFSSKFFFLLPTCSFIDPLIREG